MVRRGGCDNDGEDERCDTVVYSGREPVMVRKGLGLVVRMRWAG